MERGHSRIEVGGDLGIFLGQVDRRDVELAVGEQCQRLAEHEVEPVHLLADVGEVGRERDVHVEQRHLDERSDPACLGAFPWQQALPAGRDHGGDKIIEDARIAAEIPARLQSDAGMHPADVVGALEKGLLEPLGKGIFPVPRLRCARAGHGI